MTEEVFFHEVSVGLRVPWAQPRVFIEVEGVDGAEA